MDALARLQEEIAAIELENQRIQDFTLDIQAGTANSEYMKCVNPEKKSMIGLVASLIECGWKYERIKAFIKEITAR